MSLNGVTTADARYLCSSPSLSFSSLIFIGRPRAKNLFVSGSVPVSRFVCLYIGTCVCPTIIRLSCTKTAHNGSKNTQRTVVCYGYLRLRRAIGLQP